MAEDLSPRFQTFEVHSKVPSCVDFLKTTLLLNRFLTILKILQGFGKPLTRMQTGGIFTKTCFVFCKIFVSHRILYHAMHMARSQRLHLESWLYRLLASLVIIISYWRVLCDFSLHKLHRTCIHNTQENRNTWLWHIAECGAMAFLMDFLVFLGVGELNIQINNTCRIAEEYRMSNLRPSFWALCSSSCWSRSSLKQDQRPKRTWSWEHDPEQWYHHKPTKMSWTIQISTWQMWNNWGKNLSTFWKTNLKSFERQLSLGTEVLPASTSLVHSDSHNVWTKEASHSQTHVWSSEVSSMCSKKAKEGEGSMDHGCENFLPGFVMHKSPF